MKTIQFKFDTSDDNLHKVIEEDSRIYSDMVRFSFNRLKENKSVKEIYNQLGQVFPTAKSHYRNCASRQAKHIYDLNGDDRTPDMVAASIEIARRAYKKFTKGWFQPRFISESRIQQVLGNQWKKELELDYMSWKGLSGIIKKSKLKYRFQLNPSNAVFRKRNAKAKVEFLTFAISF